MSLLESWFQTPLAGALGWTLLHSLWEGAIVSAVFAMVLWATRSPRIRYAAGCAAMAIMLGGFALTLLNVLPQTAYRPGIPRPHAFPALNFAASLNALSPSSSWLAAAAPWLASFWIVGVWMFGLRQLAGWIPVRRLRRRGVCCAPERWQTELVRLRAQLRVSRPVLLLESSVAEVPMVLGHFRPLILMPAGLLAGLPVEQIEAILPHELAHIRRWDYFANIMQRCVEGLLFYHPAVWWISSVIRAERENCCDDVVVAMRGDAPAYAATLVTLEHNRWQENNGPGRRTAVAATGGSLMKRVRRLLYPKSPSGAWTPLFGALILMLTAAAAVVAWQAAPAPADREATPYLEWLNQDVVYIIADEERAAFLKLTTDEERKKFIEQFWERRNPTPGASENVFKEEHYRRIAYANKHWATASKAGWQTDRGHMYIVYGPPDEIESHLPGRNGIPFEDWKYRNVEGMGSAGYFTFIDRTGHGDYRLAPASAQ
ncbi:MAG TPA: GWxTD domain-containing protein [Bryobacteraceae bacterium]|jgi:GWxTD domain-containing protein|nr:GWxTD domain-containing protein [Bryobacteraceae bacterium]